MVGCCSWATGSKSCLSGVGPDVCYPEFHIKGTNGKCLGAPKKGAEIRLEDCTHDIKQYWTPNKKDQVQSPTNLCLSVDGTKINAAECTADPNDPTKALGAQAFKYVTAVGQSLGVLKQDAL